MRTSHKTPLKSTTNTREASLRTRRSTTRIKQTMRIIMREPREERTLRTIINLPQNQGIKTTTTMGVSRCCENRCWFALVFWCAYCSLFYSFLLHHCDCTCLQHQEITTTTKTREPKKHTWKNKIKLEDGLDWRTSRSLLLHVFQKTNLLLKHIINGDKNKNSGLQWKW